MKRPFFLVLFLVLMVVAAGFFPACNVDSSGDAEASILDASPRYSISITTEKEEEGGLAALSGMDGIVTVSPAGRVKPGATVTLSAYPQLIADDAGGGGVRLTPSTGLSSR